MMDWTHHSVLVNGISLSYYRSFGDKPPIVLAHGLTDDAGCWQQVADSLCTHFDVIAYDARGHGRSDAPATGYEPTHHSQDLIALISALELEQPVLLGHSMGAVTVALTAAERPQLTRRIILEDPPLPPAIDRDPSQDELTRAQDHWRRWRAAMASRRDFSPSEWLAVGRKDHPGWPEHEYESWVKSKQRVRLNVFDGTPLIASGWHRCVERIQAATLLVSGDPALGALVQHDAGEAWTQRLTHGTLVRIPNAGHSVHRDNFEAFMRSVSQFLKQ